MKLNGKFCKIFAEPNLPKSAEPKRNFGRFLEQLTDQLALIFAEPKRNFGRFLEQLTDQLALIFAEPKRNFGRFLEQLTDQLALIFAEPKRNFGRFLEQLTDQLALIFAEPKRNFGRFLEQLTDQLVLMRYDIAKLSRYYSLARRYSIASNLQNSQVGVCICALRNTPVDLAKVYYLDSFAIIRAIFCYKC